MAGNGNGNNRDNLNEGNIPGEPPMRKLVGAAGMDGGKAIVKVSFQHDAIIDVMLRRPRIEQQELAAMFGYSKGWVCRLINSDAFQARVAERKAQLTDPAIARRLNARLQGVTIQAVDVISRKLDAAESAELALEALGVSTKALGLGNKGKV